MYVRFHFSSLRSRSCNLQCAHNVCGLVTAPHALPHAQLTNSIGSLLWSTTPDHAQTLLEMSEERFVDAVNAAFVCSTEITHIPRVHVYGSI